MLRGIDRKIQRNHAVAAKDCRQCVVHIGGVGKVELPVYPPQRVANHMAVVRLLVGHHREVHRRQAVTTKHRRVYMQVGPCGGKHCVEEGQRREVADGVILLWIVVVPQMQGEGHHTVAAILTMTREHSRQCLVRSGKGQHSVAPYIGARRRADAVGIINIVCGVHHKGVAQRIVASIGVHRVASKHSVCQWSDYLWRTTSSRPLVLSGINHHYCIRLIVVATSITALKGS